MVLNWTPGALVPFIAKLSHKQYIELKYIKIIIDICNQFDEIANKIKKNESGEEKKSMLD